jgi:Flp pilus assembly protein TadG
MTHVRTFLRETRGATAIEFALLAGPFLMMMFGVIEFSRAFWVQQALVDITAKAARCVAVGHEDCTDAAGVYSAQLTMNYIQSSARGLGIELARPAAVTVNTACNGISGFTSVTAEARFESLFPIDRIMNFTSVSCFARQA